MAFAKRRQDEETRKAAYVKNKPYYDMIMKNHIKLMEAKSKNSYNRFKNRTPEIKVSDKPPGYYTDRLVRRAWKRK